jgi:hypothetical protein
MEPNRNSTISDDCTERTTPKLLSSSRRFDAISRQSDHASLDILSRFTVWQSRVPILCRNCRAFACIEVDQSIENAGIIEGHRAFASRYSEPEPWSLDHSHNTSCMAIKDAFPDDNGSEDTLKWELGIVILLIKVCHSQGRRGCYYAMNTSPKAARGLEDIARNIGNSLQVLRACFQHVQVPSGAPFMSTSVVVTVYWQY